MLLLRRKVAPGAALSRSRVGMAQRQKGRGKKEGWGEEEEEAVPPDRRENAIAAPELSLLARALP